MRFNVSNNLLVTPLNPGDFIRQWDVSGLRKVNFSVPDKVMQGKMDPLFFRKGSIPHRYPCRDAFLSIHADREIKKPSQINFENRYLPLQNNKLEFSGFYYRATHIFLYARVCISSPCSQQAIFDLTTCGGVKLWLNDHEIDSFFPYIRNVGTTKKIILPLVSGDNELIIYMDDLCERDTLYYLSLQCISGEGLSSILPLTVKSDVLESLIDLVKHSRFAKDHYRDDDELILQLAAPAHTDIQLDVAMKGEMLKFNADSDYSQTLQIKSGQTQISLGYSRDLPTGFITAQLTFSIGQPDSEIKIKHALSIEVERNAAINLRLSTFEERSRQCLLFLANAGCFGNQKGTASYSMRPAGVRVLTQFETGTNIDEAKQSIRELIVNINERHDCSDFDLVPLLWVYHCYKDTYPDSQLWSELESAILNFRYWMDEPGDDVMWYFSENHALLFHTSQLLAGQWFKGDIFSNSIRTGAQQQKIAQERLHNWFDNFFTHEMAEWNSVPYFPIDLIGFYALYELAEDPSLKEKAKLGMDRLFTLVANASHQGYLAGSQGRSYDKTLMGRYSNEISAIIWLYFNVANLNDNDRVLGMACVSSYRPPAALAEMVCYPEVDKAISISHSQAENDFARLKCFKTNDYSLATCVDYMVGQPGYQETLLQVALGNNPNAQFWINHPGELTPLGEGRPSYWAGNGICPHIDQHQNVAFITYDIPSSTPAQFIHCYIPEAEFDQVVHEDQYGFVCQDNGYMAIIASATLLPLQHGTTAGKEWRTTTPAGAILLIMGNAYQYGSFDNFMRVIKETQVKFESGEITLTGNNIFPFAHFIHDHGLSVNGRKVNNSELCQISPIYESLPLLSIF